jgi:hypothetical protein
LEYAHMYTPWRSVLRAAGMCAASSNPPKLRPEAGCHILHRHGEARERLPVRFRPVARRRDDVRDLELVERRALLQKYLAKAGPALRFCEHMNGPDGVAMFRHACAMGLEGIVSKRPTRRYRSGRCASWRKVKNQAYERHTTRAQLRARPTVEPAYGRPLGMLACKPKVVS